MLALSRLSSDGYGYGLEVREENPYREEIEDFFLDNDIASYYLGVCQDFKHFGYRECDYPFSRRHENRAAAPQRGLLLPLRSCRQGRQNNSPSLCELEKVHRLTERYRGD